MWWYFHDDLLFPFLYWSLRRYTLCWRKILYFRCLYRCHRTTWRSRKESLCYDASVAIVGDTPTSADLCLAIPCIFVLVGPILWSKFKKIHAIYASENYSVSVKSVQQQQQQQQQSQLALKKMNHVLININTQHSIWLTTFVMHWLSMQLTKFIWTRYNDITMLAIAFVVQHHITSTTIETCCLINTVLSLQSQSKHCYFENVF